MKDDRRVGGRGSPRTTGPIRQPRPRFLLPSLVKGGEPRRTRLIPLLALLLTTPLAAQTPATLAAEARRAAAAAALAERRAEAAERAAAESAARVTDALARLAGADIAVATARTRLAGLDRLRAAQRARLADRRAPVVRLLAAMQSLARRPAALALVGPGTTADIVHVRLALAAILPEITARTAALRAEIAIGDRLRTASIAGLASLAAARRDRDRERAELARLAGRRARDAVTATGIALDRSDRVLALDADLDEARAAAARQRRDDATAARLAPLPPPPLRPGPADPRLPRSGWHMPVTGRIVTGFGEATDAGVRSRGLTMMPAPGVTAVAPAPGRIGYAGPAPGGGAIVIIVHPGGWTTLVAGLTRLGATAGQMVRRGTPLGTAAGPVTIEVRHDGVVMDVASLAQRR